MASDAPLDETDHRILGLLHSDARRTIADIAAYVNLSAAPVKRRIDRMERLGVIVGYTVLIDEDKIGASIDAFAELRIPGAANVDEIVAVAKGIDEVVEVFTLAGDPDALVRIRIDDVDHLKQVINQLRLSGTFTATKTLMVLDHWSRTRDER
jgi:Lrp/AsnC family transcriptional regulator, leucine-responsive regulatory protein